MPSKDSVDRRAFMKIGGAAGASLILSAHSLAAAEGKSSDNSGWLKPDGTHVSAPNFDQNAYYWADVEGSKDLPYLKQHVFNGKHSY